MIPTRLRFSGIRDYQAIEMNLGDAGEHILITGPNGAGKSTLSFCMGAVLRSSKVDIEGLKSQNLREDETWQAAIHLLFKNEGMSRIDAPLYIEFRLNCEQLPGQPIKLQYEIYDGDELDTLTLKQTYRSGDAKQNNFGAYRRDLQMKYKVHPDLFYLIWYQQEVNQFSIMSPEERFRVFSEMHRIDRMQKEWEISLEAVKEATAAFNDATIQQKQEEHQLNTARNEKDRYEDNKRRLEENGYQYALTTDQLKMQAEKKRIDIDRLVEEYRMDVDDLADEEQEAFTRQEIAMEKQNDLKEAAAEYERKKLNSEERLKKQNEKNSHITTEMDTLQSVLSDLQEAYTKLPYSEKETSNRLKQATAAVSKLKEKEETIEQKVRRSEEEIEGNRQESANIQIEIEQWHKQSEEAENLLRKYSSSYKLKIKLAELYKKVQDKQLRRDLLEGEYQTIQQELLMLEKNEIESPRQQEAIRHLKQQHLKGYTLRHFVKLMDDMPIEKERLLNPIKYTVFHNGKDCKPLNDLYHVALKSIIPTRSVTSLPEYGITMRTDLSINEQNDAARVLWWIEQFFLKEAPYLEGERLVDARGIRGAQERETFILSKKALAVRKTKLENDAQIISRKIEKLNQEIEVQNERYRLWNADVHKVEEAEALLSKKSEQQYRLTQVEQIAQHLIALQKTKQDLDEEGLAIWKEVYERNQEIHARQEDLKVYEQFGQQSDKINRLQQLTAEHKTLKQEITLLRRATNTLEDQLDDNHKQTREHQRLLESLEDDLARINEEKKRYQFRIEEKEKEYVAICKVKEDYERELEMLTHIIPELVEKALLTELKSISHYDLQYSQSKAKAGFELARNEKKIDPNAVQNYLTLEAEVQRKKEDLQALKNLLEENEIRAIENERRLDVSIGMQVTKINLLFGEYMGEFQFEGRIKYEKTMDKHHRPVFKLFIHVRKEGHRGRLVDVSLKARGGRVGKGVSGGEESLSSLLFALSLLQNLENQAGFIVLDEFDSALDDTRKVKVFQLYEEKLARKLIILSPKAHENDYYHRFQKAFIVSHDPAELRSTVRGLAIK